MGTYKLTLAYDGTEFVGWQRQAAGTSVQGLIEDALGELDDGTVTVIGAGRTDAGVHAVGQVASVSLRREIEPDVLQRALNAHLPLSIRVVSAASAPSTFHARFDARAKHYRYRIWNGPAVLPFDRLYVWHVVGALDREAMAAAAERLEGRHDFAAVQAAGSSVATTTRELALSRLTSSNTEAAVADNNPDLRVLRVLRGGDFSVSSASSAAGHLLRYEVIGDGFLRHMVRTIVGTLVEIGRGRHPVEWMDEVLASRDRSAAGPTAPATGLFLMAVSYGEPLAGEP